MVRDVRETRGCDLARRRRGGRRRPGADGGSRAAGEASRGRARRRARAARARAPAQLHRRDARGDSAVVGGVQRAQAPPHRQGARARAGSRARGSARAIAAQAERGVGAGGWRRAGFRARGRAHGVGGGGRAGGPPGRHVDGVVRRRAVRQGANGAADSHHRAPTGGAHVVHVEPADGPDGARRQLLLRFSDEQGARAPVQGREDRGLLAAVFLHDARLGVVRSHRAQERNAVEVRARVHGARGLPPAAVRLGAERASGEPAGNRSVIAAILAGRSSRRRDPR
mmetsp:Transcript_10831/g.48830  ORF Transcript_10831/g.48830 Transcript_10831/m.48830 type:complete len:283 (+) Transcript_10831:2197-3045(+)